MSLFDSAFQIVVGIEGGYVNDPQDPGGETKFGLSKRANPDLDIANLTLEQAKARYLEKYWKGRGCDKLPWTEALLVFDASVNGGNAERWHQMFVGQPPTQFAINFQAEHVQYLASLPGWQHDARGWSRRLLKIFNEALKVYN